jgi:hypothetical protein
LKVKTILGSILEWRWEMRVPGEEGYIFGHLRVNAGDEVTWGRRIYIWHLRVKVGDEGTWGGSIIYIFAGKQIWRDLGHFALICI